MSGVIFSTDQLVMSLLKYLCIKTEYMPIAAVRLVNIVNCLSCIWLDGQI
jgi:hypothetical protein